VGATLGIRIATLTPNRYFFVEHRTVDSTGSPTHAALVTWYVFEDFVMILICPVWVLALELFFVHRVVMFAIL
jgi:hypothetical protein